MEKIIDFTMHYLRQVAHFFSQLQDTQSWTTNNIIAASEYLFIGWVSLLVIPRLLFRNTLLQLVAKIILILTWISLLLWAYDPQWYKAYL